MRYGAEQFYEACVAALAVWRVTHLLSTEEGPWRCFRRLREAIARLSETVMTCFYCLSLWVAAPVAMWLGRNWEECGLLWLALSAAAILLERASGHPADWSAPYFEHAPVRAEEEVHSHVMLRQK
jgi:hypothetical protein